MLRSNIPMSTALVRLWTPFKILRSKLSKIVQNIPCIFVYYIAIRQHSHNVPRCECHICQRYLSTRLNNMTFFWVDWSAAFFAPLQRRHSRFCSALWFRILQFGQKNLAREDQRDRRWVLSLGNTQWPWWHGFFSWDRAEKREMSFVYTMYSGRKNCRGAHPNWYTRGVAIKYTWQGEEY